MDELTKVRAKVEELDPRIKMSNTCLTKITRQMRLMLFEYYKKHKRVIERTREYLNALINLKIETDACYVNLIDYEASQFAMEQLRCVCTRLEDDIMKIDKSTGLDIYADALQQLNETNEKVEYWTTKCAEQKNSKDICLNKVKSIYKKYKKVYLKCLPKSSFNGMEYFSKKLYFLKCIKRVMEQIEELNIMSKKINKEYNKALLQTETLAKNLNSDSLYDKNSDNLLQKSYNFTFLYDKITNIQKTVNNVYLGIVNLFDFTKESFSVNSNEVSISSEYETPNTSTFFNHENSFQQKYSNSTQNSISYSNKSQNDVQQLSECNENDSTFNVNNLDLTAQYSSLQNFNLSTQIVPVINENDHDLNNSDIKAFSTSLINIENKTCQTESTNTNTNTSQINDTNDLNNVSTYDSNSMINVSKTPNSDIKDQINKDHKRPKSYFNFLKNPSFDFSNFQMVSPITLFQKKESYITEDYDSHLTLTLVEINQTKLNMNLDEYGMDSSIVNNVHLHIGMAIQKFENDTTMPYLEKNIILD